MQFVNEASHKPTLRHVWLTKEEPETDIHYRIREISSNVAKRPFIVRFDPVPVRVVTNLEAMHSAVAKAVQRAQQGVPHSVAGIAQNATGEAAAVEPVLRDMLDGVDCPPVTVKTKGDIAKVRALRKLDSQNVAEALIAGLGMSLGGGSGSAAASSGEGSPLAAYSAARASSTGTSSSSSNAAGAYLAGAGFTLQQQPGGGGSVFPTIMLQQQPGGGGMAGRWAMPVLAASSSSSSSSSQSQPSSVASKQAPTFQMMLPAGGGQLPAGALRMPPLPPGTTVRLVPVPRSVAPQPRPSLAGLAFAAGASGTASGPPGGSFMTMPARPSPTASSSSSGSGSGTINGAYDDDITGASASSSAYPGDMDDGVADLLVSLTSGGPRLFEDDFESAAEGKEESSPSAALSKASSNSHGRQGAGDGGAAASSTSVNDDIGDLGAPFGDRPSRRVAARSSGSSTVSPRASRKRTARDAGIGAGVERDGSEASPDDDESQLPSAAAPAATAPRGSSTNVLTLATELCSLLQQHAYSSTTAAGSVVSWLLAASSELKLVPAAAATEKAQDAGLALQFPPLGVTLRGGDFWEGQSAATPLSANDFGPRPTNKSRPAKKALEAPAATRGSLETEEDTAAR